MVEGPGRLEGRRTVAADGRVRACRAGPSVRPGAAASSSRTRSTHFAVDPHGRRAARRRRVNRRVHRRSAAPGSASVIALDVGRGQLDWRLRTDARVLVREGVNARSLTSDDVPYQVSLVTIDVAFISLRHILPALPAVLAAAADIVAPRQTAVRGRTRGRRQARDRLRSAVHEAVIARVHRRGGRMRPVRGSPWFRRRSPARRETRSSSCT